MVRYPACRPNGAGVIVLVTAFAFAALLLAWSFCAEGRANP